MPDIVDELLESFRASSQKLEELSDGLEGLQNAQKLVEKLSLNLGDAAQTLQGTAISHGDFITSARATNEQLGEVINVLKRLDTKSISSTLSEIVKGLKENKDKLTDIASSLADMENKAAAADAKLDRLFKQVEEGANAAKLRHKTTTFLIIIAVAASCMLIANLFGLLTV